MEKSIIRPRSFCPGCRSPIRALHNIPLLSYVFLKGRCAHCRTPISWHYPLVEFLMAALFVFHAWRFQHSLPLTIAADFIAFHLFCISVIDFQHFIIPDELSLSLVVCGIAGSFWNPYLTGSPMFRFYESLLSCAAGGLALMLVAWIGEKAFKKEAMGGGDIKLIAGTGAVLGWQGVSGPLLLGSLSGGLFALVLLLSRKKRLGEALPFGPFLSFGCYMTCIFPAFWRSFL